MSSDWYLVFPTDDSTFTVTIILTIFVVTVINIIIINVYTSYNNHVLRQFK